MKLLLKSVALLLVVAMLAGCATGYQKRGLTGGYSETRVDDSHYIVHFDGNGYASKDRVWYFWIYRCAQLTVEKGYAYFSLEPVQTSMNKPTSFDADDDQGHAYLAVLTGDADGHLIDVHTGGGGGHGGGFIYIPGGAGTVVTWHSKAVVAMYGDNVPPKTFVVRAQSVLDLLGEYIKSGGVSVPPDRASIANAATYGMAPDDTVVNVHQYLLTHVGRSAAADASAYTVPSYAIQPGRAGTAVPPPPPAPLPRSAAASDSMSSAAPAPIAPVTALAAKAAALNAYPSLAQTVAGQLGCGAVQPNGYATYVASCGSYSVVISCDGDQCRPMHTINARKDD